MHYLSKLHQLMDANVNPTFVFIVMLIVQTGQNKAVNLHEH